MCIGMDYIEPIKDLRDRLREQIDKQMRSLVSKFKDYVVVNHPDNPKYQMIEGLCTRINYGCEGNRYYYYWLAPFVEFIHLHRLWSVYAIFYDDKLKWWFVYDKEKRAYTEFNELDTDAQIQMLELLNKCIETPSPETFLEELKQRYGKDVD